MDKSSLIIVKPTSIEIPEYSPGDYPEIERSLCYYDEILHKVIPFGMYYDEESRTLHLPRGLDLSYLERTTRRRLEFDLRCNTKKPNKIRLKIAPRNDLQKKSIAFLTAQGEFASLHNRSQYILTLTTGAGKTYCTVASIALTNLVPIIMTPTDNIKSQWVDAFEAYTDVDPRDILDIKGSTVIKRILNGKIKPNYRAYVVNRQSLSSYGNKNGWDKITLLFETLGIGVKVFDEAHLTLQANLMIDYFTNVYNTYYLTATMGRSGEKENRIMKLAYKNVPSYGDESREVLRKHITYARAFFNSKPTMEQRAAMKSFRGFDLNKYSDYLMENDNFFTAMNELMNIVIEMNPDEKLRVMITTHKIEATHVMADFIKSEYPDLLVGAYNSKMEPEEKEWNKDNCNVLCTTPKSLGTGSNIEGLRFLINVAPYKSKVTADQLSGRLRYLDERGTMFIELIDNGFVKTKQMANERKKILFSKTKNNVELEL